MRTVTAGDAFEPVPTSRNTIFLIVSLFPLAFIAFGFAVDTPATFFRGLGIILIARDTPITDHIGLGGIVTAFVNAGLLTLLAMAFCWF